MTAPRGFVHKYAYTRAHFFAFYPTGIKGVLQSPSAQGACEAPFYTRNCMKCPDLERKVTLVNPLPEG